MPKKDTLATATILIIDDDQSIRDAVREGLGEATLAKLKVLEAEDVDEGLRMAKEHKPHAIILDLAFGSQSGAREGFNFLKQLRADDKLKTTKVIILTANDTLENMRTAEDLDVSAYHFVSKPFELNELIAQVYSLIF